MSPSGTPGKDVCCHDEGRKFQLCGHLQLGSGPALHTRALGLWGCSFTSRPGVQSGGVKLEPPCRLAAMTKGKDAGSNHGGPPRP